MSAPPNMVNISEARSQLSRLVETLESGAIEEIVIARNGRPAARLVPLRPAHSKKRLGLLEGRVRVPSLADLNTFDAKVAAMFGGGAKRSC